MRDGRDAESASQNEKIQKKIFHHHISRSFEEVAMMNSFIRITALLLSLLNAANGFHIVLAGGTGQVGRELSSKLVSDGHDVTILCRNAFLAAAPSRVSSDFGWLGQSFLNKYPGIKLRDWDGGEEKMCIFFYFYLQFCENCASDPPKLYCMYVGDLLDIVGQDWVGWQDDTLAKADCVVNLCGGFTQQREMATERIVRESLRCNPTALQITVAPIDEE